MGCSGSTSTHPSAQPEPAAALVHAKSAQLPPSGDTGIATSKHGQHSKGKGKGKEKGKGKGRSKINPKSKFQVTLSGEWKDYEDVEDMVLKRAFLVGQPNVRFSLRGQQYEYNFEEMKQINQCSGKSRDIRPPHGMKPPAAPLLPLGPMVVITVQEGSPGTIITIPDPSNAGQHIPVRVPENAKKGQKMAVPVPGKGETVQELHHKQQTWSTGAKVATAAGAAGGFFVGGAVLGEHLTGVAAAAGEWVDAAVDDTGAWAEGAWTDVSDWTVGATEDAGEWCADVTDDAGEWLSGATDDVKEWLGDATEDAGDFIMSLF